MQLIICSKSSTNCICLSAECYHTIRMFSFLFNFLGVISSRIGAIEVLFTPAGEEKVSQLV